VSYALSTAWVRALIACALLGGASLSSACDGGSVPVDLEEHAFEPPTDIDVGAAPWRARRRMDIAQLDASLRRVTGGPDGTDGIGWDVGTTNQFVRFDDTLGVPDFINSTVEDRAVSLIFQKFLDDAARNVCRRLVDREAGDAAKGTFAPVDVDAAEPAAADVDAALVSLLLRFHGRRLTATDRTLAPWRELHTAAAAGTETPKRAWEAVCVALIDHPDFFTY
jgi:hypothetical protein